MTASENLAGWIGWVLAAVALTLIAAVTGFYLLRYMPPWVWWSLGCVALLALAVVAAGFIFALTHMPD